jgi:hypothetical protein
VRSTARPFGSKRMELWELGFGIGVLGVFVVFMAVLAYVSEDYARSRR